MRNKTWSELNYWKEMTRNYCCDVVMISSVNIKIRTTNLDVSGVYKLSMFTGTWWQV